MAHFSPLLFALLLVAGFPQDWDAADRATSRLKPAAFRQLPAPIRAELDERGCTIPQPYNARQPANVIRGRFFSATSSDWAILCSRGRVSAILVFRDGAATPAAELARDADSAYLQTISANAIGFSRRIGLASAEYIRRHHNPSDPPLPPLDHQGIDDAFIEKGSTVHYWSQGRWL